MTEAFLNLNRVPGRLRDKQLDVDSDAHCKNDHNPDLFTACIDLTHSTPGEGKRFQQQKRRRFETAAKEVCAGCPVQIQCLAVHGQDYELGVVGGMTDRERRELFEATA